MEQNSQDHRPCDTPLVQRPDDLSADGVRNEQINRIGVGRNSGRGHVTIVDDKYNDGLISDEVRRQRQLQSSDASGAFEYIRDLAFQDPFMYWQHTVDAEGRLQQLFWCDGNSQLSYRVFGDVLSIDSTYGKKRYSCTLVVFSGVNHHNRTMIFASALISNETEDTYVWLLQQFLLAMKGKPPASVITGVHRAIRNAIRTVFPNAHHTLCARQIFLCAATKVGNPAFNRKLSDCMLAELEVDEFEQTWAEMVVNFRLQENLWVKALYDKKKMWAMSHIRENFFAGLRRSSRCEAMHLQICRFQDSPHSLRDFVQYCHHCLMQLRLQEVEEDLKSAQGDPVEQSPIHALERSASSHYTTEICNLFSGVLTSAARMNVVGCKETLTCSIYTVSVYSNPKMKWQVSFHAPTMRLTCSCYGMECYGLPCEHIVACLMYLKISQLPNYLILNRWTKNSKQGIGKPVTGGTFLSGSDKLREYAALLDRCKNLCKISLNSHEDMNYTGEAITNLISVLQDKQRTQRQEGSVHRLSMAVSLGNPGPSDSEGCGRRQRQKRRCGHCAFFGHNKRSCPQRRSALGRDKGTSGHA